MERTTKNLNFLSFSASSVIMNGAIQDDTNDGGTGTNDGGTGDGGGTSNDDTSPQRPLSSASEESEDTSSFSEDDEISFNTIKRQVPSHATSKETNTR